MCQSKSGCTQPENLKEEPKDCPAEQIAICHPGEKGHPCQAGETERK